MARLLNLNNWRSVLILALAAAALTLGTARVSWADSLGDEIRAFHRFLNNHPRIAGDLERNPGLANNSRYLHDHDNLRDFLHNHARVRRELADNPARVMDRSYAWDRRRYDDRRYDDRRYDDRPWYDWWRRR